MDIIALKKDNYLNWDQFCLSSDDAWFWHTTKLLDYGVAYGSQDYGTQNLSFLVKDDSGVVAVVPLLLESNSSPVFSISGNGGYLIIPALRGDLNETYRDKIIKTIFDRIDQLAAEHRITSALLRMAPLASRPISFNWLLKYGYLDATTNTQIIDLSMPLRDLWSAVRKGHKYDIKRGEKHYKIHLFEKENPDKEAFEHYRLLHHKAAGRITRPVETFEMMYNWLAGGEAMLCGVSQAGKYIGFSFIILYKDGAYYGSASDDPDYETNIPISHVIQWKVICWLKEKGYKRYEIGEQTFGPSLHNIPSAKDLSISLFKRGFGGETIPVFRGIKYYDHKIMKGCLIGNIEKLTKDYGAGN